MRDSIRSRSKKNVPSCHECNGPLDVGYVHGQYINMRKQNYRARMDPADVCVNCLQKNPKAFLVVKS